MGTQVGNSYVAIVHLPFPHLPHAPFSLQLWEKDIKVCLLPFTALSSYMAGLVVNSNKN